MSNYTYNFLIHLCELLGDIGPLVSSIRAYYSISSGKGLGTRVERLAMPIDVNIFRPSVMELVITARNSLRQVKCMVDSSTREAPVDARKVLCDSHTHILPARGKM